MSKAAELTREELVERIGRRLRVELDGYGLSVPLGKKAALSVLSELKALGLAVVPVEPTEAMKNAADILVGHTVHDAGPSPSDLTRGWKLMLSSSPFSGN